MTAKAFVAVMICALACLLATSGDPGWCADNGEAAPEKAIRESVPAVVRALTLDWNAEPVPAGRILRADESPDARRASNESVAWIEKTIAEGWRPDKTVLMSSLVLVRNKFDSRDASCAQWEEQGYKVFVSQTSTVIAVVITPASGGFGWEGEAAEKEGALKLARQVIGDLPPEKVQVLPGGNSGGELAPKGTLAVLLDASFAKGRVKECTDGIVGVPASDLGDSADKERMNHWWRRVGWWTDGKAFGFYTIKAEGGAWEGNFEDNLSAPWLGTIR